MKHLGLRPAAAVAAAALILLAAPSVLTASGDPPGERAVGGGGAADALQPTDLVDGTVGAVAGLIDEAVSPAPDDRPAAAGPPPGDPQARGADRGPRSAREPDRGPTARASGSGAVDIRNFAYSPRTITVRVGEQVRWTNRDRELHDARAFDGSFSTRLLEQGESDAVSFREPGSFRYFCSVHPSSQPQWADFTGTVRVLAAERDRDDRDDPAPRPDSEERADTDAERDGPSAPATADQAGPGPTAGLADRAGREDRGRGLPDTGLAVLPLLALGLVLLAAGGALRLRRD